MFFELLQAMVFEKKIPKRAKLGTLKNYEKGMRLSCASGDNYRNNGYSQGEVDLKPVLVISCVQEVCKNLVQKEHTVVITFMFEMKVGEFEAGGHLIKYFSNP